ncbi:MAG: deoxyhypusine synthase [Promethearchaeota archaeon]
MQRRYVKHMVLKRGMTLKDLIKQYEGSGVLGAGRLARAAKIVRELFQSSKFLVFLSMAGPMVPGGLRHIIADLVRTKRVNIIVTSGANVVHDIIEAIGGHHIKGTMSVDDRELAEQHIGRAGDVFIETSAFEILEDNIHKLLSQIPEEKRVAGISPSELLNEIGQQLKDAKSILRQAYLQNVPIFCPGILDSMLGLHLALFKQLQPFNLDGLKDMKILQEHVLEAKRIGAIILGGGLPKHFTLGANILRGGLESAIQITTARDEDGSLSGAKLQEGISWGKVKPKATFETVIGDATLLFPIIIGAALEQLDSD